MPWGAPIGSGKGLNNVFGLRALRAHFPEIPLIVDAGLGLPSHAAAAMELGYDGVLLNTAVAKAGDPVAMARAFGQAIEAGRAAFLAGPMEPRDMAAPSTPVVGRAVLYVSALDPFYPIVDSAAWVGRLVGVGARFIQLRVKDATERPSAQRDARRDGHLPPAGAELVVNDYWRSRDRRGARLGSISGRAISTRPMCCAMRKAGIKLGVSTHDDAELVRALTFAPDYVALGPIYPTMPQGHGVRAAGAREDRRVEAPHRRDPAGRDRRPRLSSGRSCASPPAPTSSPSSPTSRSIPIRRRARENGWRRRGRRDRRLPIALTIAGSDSGGGAGIQADLKTFAALGVYGASVVTALTAQNTRGVRAIHYPPPGIVGAQIEAVLEDFAVAAIKIGMLGSAEIVERGGGETALSLELRRVRPANEARRQDRPSGRSTAATLRGRMRAFIVYDPVMIASSGDPLSGAGFVEAIAREPAAARRLPHAQPRRGGRAARRAARAKRSGHGAPGRGAVEARPARGSDEGRPSGQAMRRSTFW